MGNVHARSEVSSPEGSGVGEGGGDEVSLDKISASVVEIHIDGIGRTKENLIADRVKPIFKVKDFQDLVLSAQEVRQELSHLGCFGDVTIHVDTMPEGGPNDYQLTFKVKELSRIKGTVNTMVGNQEGSLMTGLIFPNILGGGEKLKADYSYGTRRTNTFNASFSKPLTKNEATATASIFQQMAEYTNSSGFKELNRGVVLDLNFISAPRVAHNLSWEGVWRDISCSNKGTAFAVREHAGHTLKSSLKHILTVDRRNNPIFPSSGSFFRLNQEFAGLGGDIGFFKNEVEVQGNLPLNAILGDDYVLQGTFHGGLLKPLTNFEKSLTIADKFFLGGPINVRGFEQRGLGPHCDGNSIGGQIFWASGIHLYGALPFVQRGGFADLFRTHLFATAGNNIEQDDEIKKIDDVLRDFRFSYGLGIAFKLGGIARIELNYCVPVKSQRGDKLAPGLQLGVGVNFL